MQWYILEKSHLLTVSLQWYTPKTQTKFGLYHCYDILRRLRPSFTCIVAMIHPENRPTYACLIAMVHLTVYPHTYDGKRFCPKSTCICVNRLTQKRESGLFTCIIAMIQTIKAVQVQYVYLVMIYQEHSNTFFCINAMINPKDSLTLYLYHYKDRHNKRKSDLVFTTGTPRV